MTDIVEKLFWSNERPLSVEEAREAAAEIERLRKELAVAMAIVRGAQAAHDAERQHRARLAEAAVALRNLAEASREVGLRLFEYSDLSEVVERMRLAMIAALDVAAKLEQKP